MLPLADSGLARQPGKRALCIEERGQQGEVAKKKLETLKQVKMSLIPMHLAYSVP